eukprot:7931167-Pyramimonas_sp.AAC.1
MHCNQYAGNLSKRKCNPRVEMQRLKAEPPNGALSDVELQRALQRLAERHQSPLPLLAPTHACWPPAM